VQTKANTKHLKTHVCERSFESPICQKGFKRRYDMNYHVRNQHKIQDEQEYIEVEAAVMFIQEPFEM
jgi:hypothetical protein